MLRLKLPTGAPPSYWIPPASRFSVDLEEEMKQEDVDAEMKIFGEIVELLKPLEKLRQIRLLETVFTWVKNAPDKVDY